MLFIRLKLPRDFTIPLHWTTVILIFPFCRCLSTPQNKFLCSNGFKLRASSLFFGVNFPLSTSFLILVFKVILALFTIRNTSTLLNFAWEPKCETPYLNNNLKPINYSIGLHCATNQSSDLIPHNLVSTIVHSSPVYKKYISLISLMSFVVKIINWKSGRLLTEDLL